MMKPILSLSIIACALLPRGARADTATFSFAPLGNSYSAAMFADDPLVGKNVSAARIYLQIECFPGSDAANFFTDISLPIDPLPGGDSTLVLSGEELGWSGAGQFSFFEETNRFNGTIIPGRYGAESPSEDFVGVMLDGRIEFDIADYVIGDFDGDSELNHADIDWLSDAIILGNFSRTFDLNLDGLVDLEDHRIWVHDLKHSWYGDADLNGQFNSSDLVAVLQAGQYLNTADLDSTWSAGDWNADGKFSTEDLVWALADGGYDSGPRAAVLSVPEPAGRVLLVFAGIAALGPLRPIRQRATDVRQSGAFEMNR